MKIILEKLVDGEWYKECTYTEADEKQLNWLAKSAAFLGSDGLEVRVRVEEENG